MRRIAAAFVPLGVVLFAAGIASATPAAPRDDSKTACVSYWGEARYVIGYNHYVHLFDGCDAVATCSVSTNVNPKPQIVTILPEEHVATASQPSKRWT